jgi:hypothetical protein
MMIFEKLGNFGVRASDYKSRYMYDDTQQEWKTLSSTARITMLIRP